MSFQQNSWKPSWIHKQPVQHCSLFAGGRTSCLVDLDKHMLARGLCGVMSFIHTHFQLDKLTVKKICPWRYLSLNNPVFWLHLLTFMLFQTRTKDLQVVQVLNHTRVNKWWQVYASTEKTLHMLCTKITNKWICFDGLPMQAEHMTHNETHVAFRAHTIRTFILFSVHTRMWSFPIATCKRHMNIINKISTSTEMFSELFRDL